MSDRTTSEPPNAPPDPVESDIAGLFRLPLPAFVTARNDLAQALTRAGREDTAARVRVLPKPSVSAWVVNQLHWRHGQHLQLVQVLVPLRHQRRLECVKMVIQLSQATSDAMTSANEVLGIAMNSSPHAASGRWGG